MLAMLVNTSLGAAMGGVRHVATPADFDPWARADRGAEAEEVGAADEAYVPIEVLQQAWLGE